MEVFVQLLINGLLLGSIYAIIAIGLTLIFGIVRVVNFAHGEFLMAGMYATYLLNTYIGLHPYVAAAPLIVLFFIVGAVVQRFLIQPLMAAEEHIQIFATVGLSTAMMNLALLIFGADLYSVSASAVRNTIVIAGYSIVIGQLVMLVCAFALVGGLHVFMQKTFLGRAIRATAQNRFAAQITGVDVSRVYIFTFGLGVACVALASATLSPLYPVTPTIGTYFVLTAFVVVVLGGMRSLWGTFFGAMIIGLVDSLSGYYIAPDLKEVVYFLIFLVILIFRPTGLFGLGSGTE